MRSANDDIARLRREIEELRSDVSSHFDSIKDAGSRRGRQVWQRARRASEALSEDADQLQRQARKKIGDYPVVSVLSSFGLGILIALLLDRRH